MALFLQIQSDHEICFLMEDGYIEEVQASMEIKKQDGGNCRGRKYQLKEYSLISVEILNHNL